MHYVFHKTIAFITSDKDASGVGHAVNCVGNDFALQLEQTRHNQRNVGLETVANMPSTVFTAAAQV